MKRWQLVALTACGVSIACQSLANEGVGMAQFTIAKSQTEEFAFKLGGYSVCHELMTLLRENGDTSDEAATLKTLYQGATKPKDLRVRFLEKIERGGYNFDQMFILDEMLERTYQEALVKTKTDLSNSRAENVLLFCSTARRLARSY